MHLIIEPESMVASEPRVEFDEINVVTHRFDGDMKPNSKRYHVKYNYIIGNPPFVGARMMNDLQKQDVLQTFGKDWQNVGNLDYVCCWYKKATNLMMLNHDCRAAFVSTNSICQG